MLQDSINERIVDIKRLIRDSNIEISSDRNDNGITVTIKHKRGAAVRTIHFDWDIPIKDIHPIIVSEVFILKDNLDRLYY